MSELRTFYTIGILAIYMLPFINQFMFMCLCTIGMTRGNVTTHINTGRDDAISSR